MQLVEKQTKDMGKKVEDLKNLTRYSKQVRENPDEFDQSKLSSKWLKEHLREK